MKGKKADNCVSACHSLSLPVTPCHSLSLSLSPFGLTSYGWGLTCNCSINFGRQQVLRSAGVFSDTKQLDDREVHLQAWHAGYGHPSRRPIRCSAGQHVYTAELEGCWVCYAPVPLPLPYSLLPRDLPHLGTYIRRITRVYHMTHTDLTGMLQPSLASGI